MANVIWNPGISGTNPTVELIVNQQSQDIAGNYSVLSYSLILHRPMNISSTASKSYNVKINGVTVASGTTTIGGSGDKTIASGTAVAYHNSDGTIASLPISFYMDIAITWSGSGTGNASGSGSISLTTIPRASSGSMSNMSPNLGDVVTINITRASPAFTHHVYHDWYVGAWTHITTGGAVGTSLSWTVPKTFANKIPNSVSGTGRIAIDTYNGSTFIGTTIFNFTGNVPDTAEFKPTITSISTSEAVGGLATQFSAYVQNNSKLYVSIGDSGAYSSSIVTRTTTILGVNYSGTPFTSALLTASGTVSVTTTVTDSRRRSYTTSVNVNVVAYSPPSISTFSGFRSLSNGTQDDDDGTYLRTLMKFNVSPVNVGGTDKNTKSYKVEYKLQSAGTWSVLQSGSFYAYDSAFTSATAILNADFPYDIRLTVADWFTSTVSTFPVASAFTLMDFHNNGRSMAIGKVSNGDKLFEVGGSMGVDGLFTVGGIPMYYGIQETGANSNGNYIKFGDGTMICHAMLYLSTAVTAGSYFVFGTWTFPAAFVGSWPIVQLDQHSSWSHAFMATHDSMSLSTVPNIKIVNTSTSSLTADHWIHCFAIGRWK